MFCKSTQAVFCQQELMVYWINLLGEPSTGVDLSPDSWIEAGGSEVGPEHGQLSQSLLQGTELEEGCPTAAEEHFNMHKVSDSSLSTTGGLGHGAVRRHCIPSPGPLKLKPMLCQVLTCSLTVSWENATLTQGHRKKLEGLFCSAFRDLLFPEHPEKDFTKLPGVLAEHREGLGTGWSAGPALPTALRLPFPRDRHSYGKEPMGGRERSPFYLDALRLVTNTEIRRTTQVLRLAQTYGHNHFF